MPIEMARTYYIARIEGTLALYPQEAGGTIDHAMADDALRNFDTVLAYKHDLPEWYVRLVEANYAAGSVSWAIDGTSERTLRYWNDCAQQGHPGCINNIAFELTKKSSASDGDIRRALDLHATVVRSGNTARCAAQFSAVTMALLIHLTGVQRPGEDQVALLDKAQNLYQTYKNATRTQDPCGGGRIGLYEFMIRLDRGERQDAYLNDVLQQSASPFWRMLAGYLQDKVSDTELNKAIAADPEGACSYHFLAAWRAVQKHEQKVARTHYAAMIELTVEDCGPSTLMMQRYLKMPVPAS
jgi:hypothetical protein